jgi:hypothetical protein
VATIARTIPLVLPVGYTADSSLGADFVKSNLPRLAFITGMEQKTEHVPLESLWRIAKRRAKPSSKPARHIFAWHECAYAALLCNVHRSIAKVRFALESSSGSTIRAAATSFGPLFLVAGVFL